MAIPKDVPLVPLVFGTLCTSLVSFFIEKHQATKGHNNTDKNAFLIITYKYINKKRSVMMF